MSTSSWTDPDVIVQAIASTVGIGALAVVVWQAILTRRALKATQEGLLIARAEQNYSALLSIEAVKTRIAAHTPSADLHVNQIDDLPYAPSKTPGGYPEPWPTDHVFHVSRGHESIMIRAHVSLQNTGAVSTRFTTYGLLRRPAYNNDNNLPVSVGTEPGPHDVVLGPGQYSTGYFEVTKTVAEWIAIYEQRQLGDPGPESELTAYVTDGLDTGASYNFSVVIGGTPLRPEHPGLRETWVYAPPDRVTGEGMGSGDRPVAVTYWLSRSREIRLKELPHELIGQANNP